ncbi:MAG: glycosyltransferase [Candidatus Schekmanbacteria bacterium]|nr:glycosyltransferase [Candidatus Schekmanbacteria bacterium]
MPDFAIELSVVIVHYRCAEAIARCLESLAAFPPEAPWEVLITDNSAGTSHALERHGIEGAFSASPAPPLKVEILAAERNVGFAAGVNLAIGEARGRFLLLLNPDLVVREHTIDYLLRFARERGDGLGAVGPRLLYPDGTLQPSRGTFPTLRSTLMHLSGVRRLLPLDRLLAGRGGVFGATLGRYWAQLAPLPAAPECVDYTTGAALLVPAAVIDRIGALDSGFFLFYEEIDWAKRMDEAGLARFFHPGAVAIHTVGESSGATDEDRARVAIERLRSMLRYFAKHSPALLPLVRAVVAATALGRLAAAAARRDRLAIGDGWKLVRESTRWRHIRARNRAAEDDRAASR